MTYEKSVVIFTSNSVQEVELKRAQLESEGIPSFISDDNTSTWFPHLTQALGGVKLHVPQKIEEQAREALNLLHQPVICPSCKSEKVVFLNIAPFWSTLLSIYFGFPLPLHRQPHYNCSDCQHNWVPEKDL